MEKERQAIIRKGELFTLASGEYSDHSVHALCKATRDFSPDEEMAAYKATHPPKSDYREIDHNAFAAWLINERKLGKELRFAEFHMGDYGKGHASVFEMPGYGRRTVEV